MKEDADGYPFMGLQALAAIGEAMLMATRGDYERVKILQREASRFTSDNRVLKALTHLCSDVADDPAWELSRAIGDTLPGRRQAAALIDTLFDALEAERQRAPDND